MTIKNVFHQLSSAPELDVRIYNTTVISYIVSNKKEIMNDFPYGQNILLS